MVIAILGITAFLMSRMGHLQMDTNPDLWAPQKHVYMETTNLLDKIFGGKNYTVIGIVPKQGNVYQPQVLAKIKRIQEVIKQSPYAVRHNVLSFAARKVKAPGAYPRAVGEGPHRRAEVMRFNQPTKGVYI